jgi:hypothetical protein
MPHDPAVGALLLAGAVACAGAGVVRPAGRIAHWAFAAALVCAAAGEATGAGTARERLAAAACAVAAAGVVALVLGRSPLVGRLSWLDAAMGSSSAAAVAVAVGARAPEAIAAGGAAGGLALSRWRPDPLVLLAAAGTAALVPAASARRPRPARSPSRPGCGRRRPRRGPSSAASCSPRSSPSRRRRS